MSLAWTWSRWMPRCVSPISRWARIDSSLNKPLHSKIMSDPHKDSKLCQLMLQLRLTCESLTGRWAVAKVNYLLQPQVQLLSSEGQIRHSRISRIPSIRSVLWEDITSTSETNKPSMKPPPKRNLSISPTNMSEQRCIQIFKLPFLERMIKKLISGSTTSSLVEVHIPIFHLKPF